MSTSHESSTDEQPAKTPAKGITLRLDYRIITFLLLAVIAAMLVVWKPWKGTNRSDDTVSVTGSAKVKAEPDEFVFYPMYEVRNKDRTTALKEISNKSNEVVNGLKNVGVAEKDIKNNSNGYDYYSYPEDKTGGENTVYNLSFTVTVGSKDLAQKVQDYLVSTNPSGQITPLGQFNDETRKRLEDEAREKASQDARTKAEKSARLLGYKLDRVKSVQDGTGFGGEPIPFERAAALDASSPSLILQPGQEEVYYTVSVTYYVR